MNGHDFTREQNMEARMTLAVARRDARRHGACGRLTRNGRLDVTASIPALTPEEEQPPLDGCEGDWKVKWDTGQGKLSVRGRKAMLEGESL